MKVEAGEFTLIYDPSAGEDDEWYINDHTIFRDRHETWHLIGITHREPAAPHDETILAHATAPAVTGPWAKQAVAAEADPAAGETILWAPHVIEHRGIYLMFVCAGGVKPSEFRIHQMTSDDGWTWSRHESNPMVVDGYEARDPMLLRVGDSWVMYYTATTTPNGGKHIVTAVESDDLVHWGGRRTVYEDAISGTGGGPTESPFVVDYDGRYFLFIGPDWQGMLDELGRSGTYDPATYRRTRILGSDDPFAFDAADEVGRIDAHAAEVIIDESGATWVSHCGWGQGGVYLAPLRFSDDVR